MRNEYVAFLYLQKHNSNTFKNIILLTERMLTVTQCGQNLQSHTGKQTNKQKRKKEKKDVKILTLHCVVDSIAEATQFRLTPVHGWFGCSIFDRAGGSTHCSPDRTVCKVACFTQPHHSPLRRFPLTAQWDRLFREVLHSVRSHFDSCSCWTRILETCNVGSKQPLRYYEIRNLSVSWSNCINRSCIVMHHGNDITFTLTCRPNKYRFAVRSEMLWLLSSSSTCISCRLFLSMNNVGILCSSIFTTW